MRENLIQYVYSLFIGAPDCADIQQEILQNTLDRYDDLIAQGVTPEQAYQLAIQNIGDLNDILGKHPQLPPYEPEIPLSTDVIPQGHTESWWKLFLQAVGANRTFFRALAVALFILCPAPAIIMDAIGAPGEFGVVLLLMMIAAGVALLMLTGKQPSQKRPLHALAVACFILCPAPAIIMDAIGAPDEFGVVLLLMMIAVGVILLMLKNPEDAAVLGQLPFSGTHSSHTAFHSDHIKKSPLVQRIQKKITYIGLIVYFVLSFATRAWSVTWLIFPILFAAKRLALAILDLVEVINRED